MFTLATLKFLTLGLFLGLSAGITPGPLLTLIITETIKQSKKEGIKVALSPLITDFPIILVSLFILSQLSQFHQLLAVISFLGAVFIAYLGYETIRTKGLIPEGPVAKPVSLKKGVIVNFLNPNPYLFWCTIGAPLIFQAFGINLVTVIVFLLAFYVALMGSIITIVIIVSHSKAFLKGKIYIWMMRILGMVLFLFAVLFIRDGLKYFLDK
jgi:threonine/homoserine/homoserine lactone efflux protein